MSEKEREWKRKNREKEGERKDNKAIMKVKGEKEKNLAWKREIKKRVT